MKLKVSCMYGLFALRDRVAYANLKIPQKRNEADPFHDCLLIRKSAKLELRASTASCSCRALEAGSPPSREGFLTRFPKRAGELAACLDALEFVRQAGSQFQSSAPGVDEGVDDVRPEGPLGDFRLVREIGRGGMGVVYEAVQISLGRRVALKVLPFAAAMDAKQLQRFKNEAQAAAHLQHTNIVPVHFVGCERGVHFYAMQFIEGETLANVIHELRLGELG